MKSTRSVFALSLLCLLSINLFAQIQEPAWVKDAGTKTIPVHWKKLLEKVPATQGIPVFKNIYVNNLVATGARRAISVSGMAESIVDGFFLSNVSIDGRSAGSINYSKGWRFKNEKINAPDSLKVTNCTDMEL